DHRLAHGVAADPSELGRARLSTALLPAASAYRRARGLGERHARRGRRGLNRATLARMDFWAPLDTEDPEIAQVARDEEERSRSHIELIASESYPSLAVLQATGSVLTAKYAEGYPGRRYYGRGCVVGDGEGDRAPLAHAVFS